MRTLNDVLQRQSWHLGEAEPGVAASAAMPQESRDQLVDDLKLVIRGNENYFRICVGALVIVFLGCCALLFAYHTNTRVMSGLFTVTGVSFAAIAPQMLSFWREKVRTDTVLILARQLPPGETMQLIQLLLAHPAR